MKLSLRARTILYISITILFFGIVSITSIFLFTRSSLLQNSQHDLELIVSEKAYDIGRLFGISKAVVESIAEDELLINYLRQEDKLKQEDHVLEHLIRSNIGGRYEAIYVMDEHGDTFVSTDETFVGNNYSFRPYFKEALQGISGVSVARGVTSGRLGYYFSHPVYKGSDIIGVVVAKLNPNVLHDYLNPAKGMSKTFNVIFTDQYGVVVYADIPERIFASLGVLGPDVVDIIKDERIYETLDIEPLQYQQVQDFIYEGGASKTMQLYDDVDKKQEILVADRIEGYPFYLVVEQDVGKFVGPINQIIFILVLFISFAIFASVILVSLIVNRFVSSIKKLQEAAIKVSEGDFSHRLERISPYTEINDVGLAFNMMIENVKKSRKEIEQKVQEQVKDISESRENLENQQKAILNILEDVEEEKQESTRLASELSKYKLALDGASDHIIITDKDGIIIYANKSAELITGYTIDEMVGTKSGKLWGGHMDAEFYARMWKTIKDDKNIFQGQLKNKRKNGELYDAEISITPILDTNKNVHYFLAIERDITERKEAEEQVRKVLNDLQEQAQILAEEKAKDEALLENIGDGIIATNQDGVINMVNNAALEMLEFQEKEMLNKSVIDVLKLVDEKGNPVSVSHRPMVNALATGEKTSTPLGTTYYYQKKDGTRFPVGITVTPFVWQGKIIGTIETFRDITIEKGIDTMKTEFVSLASHQLRTPLSTINWYAEMLLEDDAGKLSKEQREYLQEIYSGNQRMVELVNALLNVSRIELGTFAVDPEMTDLKEVSDSVFDELKPQIGEKKMHIEKKYDKQLKPLMLDKKLIRIVFQNLLTNAVKYTPEKGTISLNIQKRIKEKDILITVSDNGYGIPKSQQKQIFTKMFRADNVKAKDTTGTGLGLYIIKSIVEQTAGGKIWFESKEDKGTTFYVSLPLGGMQKKEGSKALT